MDNRVQLHWFEALLIDINGVLHGRSFGFGANFTLPEIEFVEELAESHIIELEGNCLVVTEGMRNEWKLEAQPTVIDVDVIVSPHDFVHVWNPSIVRGHFGHHVSKSLFLEGA